MLNTQPRNNTLMNETITDSVDGIPVAVWTQGYNVHGNLLRKIAEYVEGWPDAEKSILKELIFDTKYVKPDGSARFLVMRLTGNGVVGMDDEPEYFEV